MLVPLDLAIQLHIAAKFTRKLLPLSKSVGLELKKVLSVGLQVEIFIAPIELKHLLDESGALTNCNSLVLPRII